VFILQTYAKSIECFQKHAKLIENRFSRSKVLLTRVWEILTDAGTPGTERVIAFSQLAVKGLTKLDFALIIVHEKYSFAKTR
jgi:hypothetical protein